MEQPDMKDSNKSRAAARAAALAKLLGDEARTPLTLNPSEKRPFNKTAAEHKLAVMQGNRKRRNDILFALLSGAGSSSPMGASR
jgi:hypothetical protein